MDEPAEPVAAADRGLVSRAERDQLWRGLRGAQPERSVRALAVLMLDVLAEDLLEVAPAEDEQPVQELLLRTKRSA